jgi:hypothetical protein
VRFRFGSEGNSQAADCITGPERWDRFRRCRGRMKVAQRFSARIMVHEFPMPASPGDKDILFRLAQAAIRKRKLAREQPKLELESRRFEVEEPKSEVAKQSSRLIEKTPQVRKQKL